MTTTKEISLKNSACKAPCFAIRVGLTENYRIMRGCCDRWTCDRCRKNIAKAHHTRIVLGAKEIAAKKKGFMESLYLITVTCKGKELSREDALEGYFDWTTKFLDACYSRSKRLEAEWQYVQVTELQKRGHPHSHFVINWCLNECYFETYKGENRMRVRWIERQLERSGLGRQYDISTIHDVNIMANYIAKYLFKDTSNMMFDFPKRWKRVRYSQTWPKVEKDNVEAVPLVSDVDWLNLYYKAHQIKLIGDAKEIGEMALNGLVSKFV